jgi:hypothetical protein
MILILLLSEGRAGEACKPSKKFARFLPLNRTVCHFHLVFPFRLFTVSVLRRSVLGKTTARAGGGGILGVEKCSATATGECLRVGDGKTACSA